MIGSVSRSRPKQSGSATATEVWRWSLALEMIFGEVMVGGEPPPLWEPVAQRWKRGELTREPAIQLWVQKRQRGW